MVRSNASRCRRTKQEGNQGHPHPIWPNIIGRWSTSLRVQEVWRSRRQGQIPEVLPLSFTKVYLGKNLPTHSAPTKENSSSLPRIVRFFYPKSIKSWFLIVDFYSMLSKKEGWHSVVGIFTRQLARPPESQHWTAATTAGHRNELLVFV